MNQGLALVTAVAMLSACASGTAADFEAQLTSPGGDAYKLLIYDGSGLVTGARAAQRPPPGVPPDDVVAFPERREIEVGWTGGACHHQPTIEISGDVTNLRVDIRNPDDPNWLPFLPIGCPAVGVPLRVTLSLTEPVETIAIDLEVHYE